MNLKFSKDKEMGKNCTFGTLCDGKKTSTRATLRELKTVRFLLNQTNGDRQKSPLERSRPFKMLERWVWEPNTRTFFKLM